ncbi:MAG TPA: two-component system response regulator [Nitrospiraceae bacterium]|jgi:two-component system chemotaxis response regulator CheY|nr:two-component system response regulator [Nitrospiraceae bacterium]
MSKTIMAVDDSASVRMMVNFTLSRLGFEIVEAVNGKDALKKLDKKPVHMLIADVNMPELDGISLVRKVREHPSYRFIPIIILTTESQKAKKQEGKAAGATGWIVKPFKPDQLIAVVKKVLA